MPPSLLLLCDADEQHTECEAPCERDPISFESIPLENRVRVVINNIKLRCYDVRSYTIQLAAREEYGTNDTTTLLPRAAMCDYPDVSIRQ